MGLWHLYLVVYREGAGWAEASDLYIEVGIQYKISVKTEYPGNPFQRTWPRESIRVCAPLIMPEVATNYHLPACHNFTVALLARAFDCDPAEMTSQQR